MTEHLVLRLAWQWVDTSHVTTLHQLEVLVHHYARLYGLSAARRAVVMDTVTAQFRTHTAHKE